MTLYNKIIKQGPQRGGPGARDDEAKGRFAVAIPQLADKFGGEKGRGKIELEK